MKNRIVIVKGHDILDFYLVNKCGSYYMFTQKFSKGVYDYFRDGRAENEIRSFRNWRKNPRLNKTIEKLPMYIKYVMQEFVVEDLEQSRIRRENTPQPLWEREAA